MTEQEIIKRKKKELLEREALLERAKKLIGSSVFYEGEPRKIEDVGYIEGWGFDFNLENYHIIYFGEKGLIDFLESGEHRDSITGELICWLVPTKETDDVVSEETAHTTNMFSELEGKYLQMEYNNAIINGYIKRIIRKDNGGYGVIVAGATHIFNEQDMLTLYHKRKVGYNIFLFDNEQDCINNIAAMREVVSEETTQSEETTHTTTALWKERWWDVYFEQVKHGVVSEYLITSTNSIIQDAMKGINDFFKEKEVI